ncbi:hypothetical protein C0Q70_21651 [Pomacea canaliculata]|uniref:MYND-type domain-containing protein n=1 Tax=Pomacea canaliculata TaxID=400727 RepID=A0A2T7ND73_POMCA|nr:hypothetical protein C0Q70_21651 [Pomacea canaliculata]
MDSMLCLNTSTTFQSSIGSSLSEVKYKSGANFSGHVQNYKKIGSGTFTWPDGSFYVGEYVDNYRHGNGLQQWADGTLYTGCFVKDFRHGEGAIKWSNGETYEGTFFKDRRHGKGKYTWPDNSSYIGSFYIDKKEGYGTFYFPDGKRFEGLYKDDEREGPGIFTYEDGHQDVGFWHGECVIKLLTQIENAFTIKYHPEFEYHPQIMSIHIDPTIDGMEHVKDVLQPSEMFDYIPEVKTNHILTKLYVENLDPHSLAVDHQAFDIEFFKDLNFSEKSRSEILLWNKTPSLVNLQIHIFKHRLGATSASFMVDKILQFDRSSFKECGILETSSEELIKMAAAGNTKRLGQLLNSGTVHPDVSDRHGFTALVAATINWHQDSINILLNAGANINQLTDEGVSALTAGMIFYYPIESFQKNIAEKYMMKTATAQPQDQSNSQNSSTVTVSQKELKISQPDQINQHKTEEVQLHISEELSESKTKDIKNEESQVIIQKDNVSEVTAMKKNKDDSCNREEVRESDKDSMLDDQEKDKEIDEEFESNVSVHNFEIDVTDYLVERCATQLSLNERIISQESTTLQIGKARKLAIQMSLHSRMKETLELLLRRGANPNTSDVPMPVLFLAIKAADVDMVRTLLLHGASTQISLPEDKGCLAPLHIACAIPGEEGVAITELLLNALADPDVRALEDDSFINQTLEEEWSKDTVSKESKLLLGGRTPLHIACARDDNFKNACRVVHLLLEHNANPNLLCNGFSPLALAIASGNDLAIDKLLQYGADPSLTLTHGVGSALCVATSTEYEHRRTIQGRIQLIDQLIKAGANILAPIPVGPKRSIGTAVDFAYYMFNQDRRIAHMPYHALTHSERETYNARRKLLAHIGDILRDKSVKKDMHRLKDEENKVARSISSSADFVYVGAGESLKAAGQAGQAGQVTFEHKTMDDDKNKKSNNETLYAGDLKKPLNKYCYECGRSVGIRLSACTRCKEVFYCSKACKLKAWNARHREECIRVGGRSRSPSPMGTGKRHLDSPGFAHADQVKVNKTQDSASMVYTDKVIKTQPSPTLTHVDKAKKTQPSPTLTYVDKAKKTKHSVAAEISKNKNRLKANARIKSFFFL